MNCQIKMKLVVKTVWRRNQISISPGDCGESAEGMRLK